MDALTVSVNPWELGAVIVVVEDSVVYRGNAVPGAQSSYWSPGNISGRMTLLTRTSSSMLPSVTRAFGAHVATQRGTCVTWQAAAISRGLARGPRPRVQIKQPVRERAQKKDTKTKALKALSARPALDAAVSTLEVPWLDEPYGMFVMADCNCLVTTSKHKLQLLTPAGLGDEDEDEGFEDGKGANARLNCPCGMTVDAAGHIVVADTENNALRRVSKAGEVSTLAGNGEEGFADGQGVAARFNGPDGVALAANDEFVVADTENHSIRVVTPGAVPCARSLATGRLALQTGRAPPRASNAQWAWSGTRTVAFGGRHGQQRCAAGDDGGGGERGSGQRGGWLCRRRGRGRALQSPHGRGGGQRWHDSGGGLRE